MESGRKRVPGGGNTAVAAAVEHNINATPVGNQSSSDRAQMDANGIGVRSLDAGSLTGQ